MEWKLLRNANRDAEREHLNRILKDMQAAINSIQSTLDSVQASVNNTLSTAQYASIYHTHSMSEIVDLPTLDHGTYTPVDSSNVNITSLTLSDARYFRVGDVVTVSGEFDANATGGGTTSFEMDLPIASNLGLQSDLSGNGSEGSNHDLRIRGSITNNTAVFEWNSHGSGSHIFTYVFSYTVI